MTKYYYEVKIEALLSTCIPVEEKDDDALTKAFLKWAESRGIVVLERSMSIRQFKEMPRSG